MAAVVIAVVSDDRIFSEEVVRCIRTAAPYKIAGASAPGLAGFSPQSDPPDILLVDSRLPNPLRFCASARDQDRPLVIFLVAPDDDEWMLQAIAAGARGIVAKDAPPSDIIRAVTAVREDQIWAPRRILGTALLNHQRASLARDRHPEALLEQRLSIREREVLRNMAAGLSNKEVADRLGIRPATVKVHLMNIFQKLGMRSRGELAAAYNGARLPRPARERSLTGRQSA
uniref:Transcriptional regulator NarL n=1 Tax=uncultured bacterium 259 TaxID=698386 RepID=E3T6R1_9BACT|nr:transcriptional regulator NarL [uncultured bacterium 259]